MNKFMKYGLPATGFCVFSFFLNKQFQIIKFPLTLIEFSHILKQNGNGFLF